MDVLFCPTVGPILEGSRPGVSLYSVLIFSSNVVFPAPSRPMIMIENSSLLSQSAPRSTTPAKSSPSEVFVQTLEEMVHDPAQKLYARYAYNI